MSNNHTFAAAMRRRIAHGVLALALSGIATAPAKAMLPTVRAQTLCMTGRQLSEGFFSCFSYELTATPLRHDGTAALGADDWQKTNLTLAFTNLQGQSGYSNTLWTGIRRFALSGTVSGAEGAFLANTTDEIRKDGTKLDESEWSDVDYGPNGDHWWKMYEQVDRTAVRPLPDPTRELWLSWTGGNYYQTNVHGGSGDYYTALMGLGGAPLGLYGHTYSVNALFDQTVRGQIAASDLGLYFGGEFGGTNADGLGGNGFVDCFLAGTNDSEAAWLARAGYAGLKEPGYNRCTAAVPEPASVWLLALASDPPCGIDGRQCAVRPLRASCSASSTSLAVKASYVLRSRTRRSTSRSSSS